MEQKIKFRSQYDPVEVIPAPSGNGKEPKFAFIVENGKKVRKQVGEINLYELIQASKDSCDIYSILERASHGEANLINIPNYGFMDLAGMPLSEDERIAIVTKAREDFNNLSPEIKQAFGNSFANFYNAVAENKLAEVLKESQANAAQVQSSANNGSPVESGESGKESVEHE